MPGLKASLAEDYFFDDPALSERVTVDRIANYMSDWRERVKALGGTGEITSQDRATGPRGSWQSVTRHSHVRYMREACDAQRIAQRGPDENRRQSKLFLKSTATSMGRMRRMARI
jgi:hypothetical protein